MKNTRDVNILINGRDNSDPAFKNVQRNLQMTERKAKSFDTSGAAGMFRLFSVVSKLEIGFSALNMAAQAHRGEWEGVRDTLFTLPLGIGSSARALDGFLGNVTGIRAEIEAIEASTKRTERLFEHQLKISERSLAIRRSFTDMERSFENRIELAGLEGFDRSEAQVRQGAESLRKQIAEQAKANVEEIKRATNAAVKVQQEALGEGENRLPRAFLAPDLSVQDINRLRREHGMTGTSIGEITKQRDAARAALTEIERLRRDMAQRIEAIEDHSQSALVSAEKLHLAQRAELWRTAGEQRLREQEREADERIRAAERAAIEQARAEAQAESEAERRRMVARRTDDLLGETRIMLLREEIQMGNKSVQQDLKRLEIARAFDQRARALRDLLTDETLSAERRLAIERSIAQLRSQRQRRIDAVGSEQPGDRRMSRGLEAFESRRLSGHAAAFRHSDRQFAQREEDPVKKETREIRNEMKRALSTISPMFNSVINILTRIDRRRLVVTEAK